MNSSIPKTQQQTKNTIPKLNLSKLKKPTTLHTTRNPILPKPVFDEIYNKTKKMLEEIEIPEEANSPTEQISKP